MAIFHFQKYTLWLLLACGALLINPMLNTDVFELPKLAALFVLVAVLTVLQVFDFLKNRSGETFKNALAPFNKLRAGLAHHDNRVVFGFLALFAIAQLGAFLFSSNHRISAFGEPMRFQGFITVFYYLLLFLNTYLFFRKLSWFPSINSGQAKLTMTGVFRIFPIITALVCLFALGPYVFPMTFPFYIFTPAFFDDRVFGTFGNPNYLAVFLIAMLPFVFFDESMKKILKTILVALVLTTLFLTGTRSAWLCALLVFSCYGIFDFIRFKGKTVLIGTTVVMLLLGGGWAWQHFSQTPAPLLARITLDTQQSTSLQTRVVLWKAGWKLFMTRPFFGYGQDNIRDAIEPYLPEYLQSNEVFFVDRTHSEFIDMLAMEGIFALIGYVGFFGMLLWRGFKFSPKDPALLAITMILLFQAVNFSTTSSNILLYFFAGYLLAKTNRNATLT